jgi:hypothetical protein
MKTYAWTRVKHHAFFTSTASCQIQASAAFLLDNTAPGKTVQVPEPLGYTGGITL